jgi:hypothetical protein
VDTDCGGVGLCRSGICQGTLQLNVAEPASGTATNGTVHVSVTVQGTSPAAVEIVLTAGSTDTTLATVAPPFAFDWDTRSVPEGTYQLRGRVVAGSDHYDSPPVSVVVDRTRPPPPSLAIASPTRAQPVPVSGAAEPNAIIAIYEGTNQLGQATANGAGTWTAEVALPDGNHALTATATDAAGNVSDPASATVVCVRQNPTVLERVPIPGTGNVWSRDPITVTFTRALHAPTVNGTSVQYIVNGVAQAIQPPQLDAPAQNGTQTLRIQPVILPEVSSGQAEVEVVLTDAIQDVAGNPLQAPSTAWTWTVPEWQEIGPAMLMGYGGDGLAISSGTDETGEIYAATRDAIHQGPLEVFKAAGGAWAGQGQVTTTGPYGGSGREHISLKVDATGRPVVAFVDGQANAGGVYVKRLEGSTWVPLEGALNANPSTVSHVSLQIDASDRPLVLWSEVVDATTNLFVKRWNGSGWDPLGSGIPTTALGAYSLAVSAAGAISIAYVDNGAVELRRFYSTNGIWQPAPSMGGAPSTLSLAFDNTGAETLAYNTSGTISVARWSPRPSQVGRSLAAAGSATEPWLVCRPSGTAGGEIVLGYDLNVAALDGADWRSISAHLVPAPAPSLEGHPVLSMSRTGLLSLAWAEQRALSGSGNPYLRGKRYNR